MKKTLLATLVAFISFYGYSQCNTMSAVSCVCDGASSNCDLLPDIKVGPPPLSASGTYGIIEYSQSGNGENDGRLRVSVSTPNVGHGPLAIDTIHMFICGTDTFIGTPPANCADGSAPRIMIRQRVFHKNGGTMSSYYRFAGTMTYHPTHGHMHVDDWGIYTLRYNNGDPNPLNWPIVADGAKLAFCVMDYGTCGYYNGHCLDDNGNVLTGSSNIPNYGLGGGSYNCSPTIQGISVGYTDIYYQYLDGMWIDIPPGTCNGDYYIVVHVDPNNNFLEEDETNNVLAVPYTLTQQSPPGNPSASISSATTFPICEGNAATLHADQWGFSYQWSNGATTRDISVTQPGAYMVTITSPCGSATSSAYNVSFIDNDAPSTASATVCSGQNATLNASGLGTLNWFDAPAGGNLVNTGSQFIINNAVSNQTFYVQNENLAAGASWYNTPNNNSFGSGANHTTDTRYLSFTVTQPLTLQSVKVYANGAGNRTIALRDDTGADITSVTANIPNGESRVTLNLHLNPGSYRLGTASGSNVNMFRNDGGVSYPYIVNSALSITGSSAGSAYYYFYYDWEAQLDPTVCISARTPVTAALETACVVPTNPNVSNITATSATIGFGAGCNSIKYKIRYRQNGTMAWQMLNTSTTSKVLNNLLPSTTYKFSIRNKCASGLSAWTPNATFTTSSLKSVPIENVLDDITLFPNPNNGTFSIKLNGLMPQEQVSIRLFNLVGQEVYSTSFVAEQSALTSEMNLNTVPGMYYITVVSGEKKWVKNVVIE